MSETARVLSQAVDQLIEWVEEEDQAPAPSLPFHGLGGGYPGIILSLLDYSVAADSSEAYTASRKLLRKLSDYSSHAPYQTTGLHSGLAGLFVVTALAADVDSTYERLAHTIGEQYCRSAIERIPFRSNKPDFSDFDYIEGAAGQLVAARIGFELVPRLRPQLQELMSALSAYLCGIASRNDTGSYGWLVMPRSEHNYIDETPYGSYNLGFAHGLPGVMAAISLAPKTPQTQEALSESIRVILRTESWDSTLGPSWPYQIAADEKGRLNPNYGHRYARSAWCYGTPGILIGLLSSTRSTGKDVPSAIAARDKMFDALSDLPLPEIEIFSATLCHGALGVATVLKTLTDADSSADHPLIDKFVNASIDFSDTTGRFILPNKKRPGESTDDPGYLTGQAGAILGLTDEIYGCATKWRTLISPLDLVEI